MTTFCLPKESANEFKKALKEKKIEMKRLLFMTTEERTKLFSPLVGKEAKKVNQLFEQKLVLKNKLQGLKNWASKVGQIGRYSPEGAKRVKSLLEEYKDKQKERMFSPKEDESFLSDLVEEKFGTRITKEEAKTVFDLTKKVEDLRKSYSKEWSSDKDRSAYGANKVILENYTNNLKEEKLSVKDMIKQFGYEIKQTWGENKAKAVSSALNSILKTILDNSIAMVASIDDSFLGRQGLNAFWTHPTKWWYGAKNSFVDIYKVMSNKPARDALWADIYSKPNYLNGKYAKAKLVPKYEEQYPTQLPERLPLGIGKLFKASEQAFTGSAIRMRTGVFDLLDKIAENGGVDINSDIHIKSLGKLVNSLTARGQWGKRGEPGFVRIFLWAPRMLKANIDVLTMHGLGAGLETPFTRKQAALNLLKIIVGTAAVLGIAKAINKESVEENPTSSNWGKINVGHTHFDVTGGKASIITLAFRLLTGTVKSATTGVVHKLGSGFAETSRLDVLHSFLEGKSPPPTSEVISWLKGRNWHGHKPTPLSSLYRITAPISITNAIELKDDKSASAILGVILDGLGVNANTYSYRVDWTQNTSKELSSFRKKFGDEVFKQANKEYNDRFNNWLDAVKVNFDFARKTDKEKQEIITTKKRRIKKEIITRGR